MKVNNLVFILLFSKSICLAQEIMPLEYDWQKEIAVNEIKTVLHYFLLLPKDVVYCEPINSVETQNSRKEFLEHINIKNGYVNNSGMEVALFKDRMNSKDILAVQRGGSGVGSTCGGINAFYEFIAGRNGWIYRNDLLPDDSIINESINKFKQENETDEVYPYYDLPEYGLEIKLTDDETGIVICRFKWSGDKFILIE